MFKLATVFVCASMTVYENNTFDLTGASGLKIEIPQTPWIIPQLIFFTHWNVSELKPETPYQLGVQLVGMPEAIVPCHTKTVIQLKTGQEDLFLPVPLHAVQILKTGKLVLELRFPGLVIPVPMEVHTKSKL